MNNRCLRASRIAKTADVDKAEKGSPFNLDLETAEIYRDRITQLRVHRDEIDAEIAELEARIASSRANGTIEASIEADARTGFDQCFSKHAEDAVAPFNDKLEQIAIAGTGATDTFLLGKIVTKSSLLEDKFELFALLFAGRPDVHAKRWQSAKTGKSGYSPYCQNAFDRTYCTKGVKGAEKSSCMNCEHRAFPPISLAEFREHLRGEKENCSDVLGAYPMDAEEMCSFIVADFDNENRKEGEDAAVIDGVESFEMLKKAALAFRQTCLKNTIPAYLEISRSGEGMHVWVFFADRIEGRQARRLCAAMLMRAMNEYPDIRFNSYDRLIPNQDMLPKNGIGNLIALPLQGRAGKRRHSVFVDGDIVMYPDQWEFLSMVRRLPAKDAAAILMKSDPAGELGELLLNEEGEEATKPWEKKKPEINLTDDDFSGEMEIVRANMIHIPKACLSVRAVNKIRRLGAFRNPEFYKAQAMRRSTWNVSRIISTADETDAYISIPRGAEVSLRELLDNAGFRYSVEDKTTMGKTITVSFVGELRDEQKPAAEAMLGHEIGVLSATAAFGKTVIGAYLIASRKVNALVLVHTNQLLGQWKTRLGTFLHIDEEPPERFTPTGRRMKTAVIGEHGGSKKNLSGIVDVATIQSIHQDGEAKEFVKDYGLVIIDECHHVPAASFEAVLKQVNAKYLYGLTATPTREDGCHAIMFLECGPIRYRVDAKAQADKRPFGHFVTPRFTRFLSSSVQDENNYVALLGALGSDENRNRMIADDIVSAVAEGRKPLVLTERVEHIALLEDALSGKIGKVIKLIGGMGNVRTREINQMLNELRDDERFVILATGQYVGEGFDFPRLDTLFLTMPIKSRSKVTQYTGRLHRLHQGKSDVIVYDYVDVHIPMFERMYYTRIRGYKSLGYRTIVKSRETEQTNIIFSLDEYWERMAADMETAKKEIIISSPVVSGSRITQAMPILSTKSIDSVVIAVVTKPPREIAEKYRAAAENSIKRLSDAGMKVVFESGLHQRFVVIDQRIVWYGSVNPLGFLGKEENILRLDSADVAAALLNQKFGRLTPTSMQKSDNSPTQLSLFNK